jgi:hypothetical protein
LGLDMEALATEASGDALLVFLPLKGSPAASLHPSIFFSLSPSSHIRVLLHEPRTHNFFLTEQQTVESALPKELLQPLLEAGSETLLVVFEVCVCVCVCARNCFYPVSRQTDSEKERESLAALLSRRQTPRALKTRYVDEDLAIRIGTDCHSQRLATGLSRSDTGKLRLCCLPGRWCCLCLGALTRPLFSHTQT